MSDEKAYEWFCEQYDANDSLRVHPQDEVARARAALDAAEALVRSLKHKKSVISAGGKRMGQPATLHADAPDQDVVEIEAMILTGTLSSLHKAAQLMEQDAEERPTVWMDRGQDTVEARTGLGRGGCDAGMDDAECARLVDNAIEEVLRRGR